MGPKMLFLVHAPNSVLAHVFDDRGPGQMFCLQRPLPEAQLKFCKCVEADLGVQETFRARHSTQ